MLGILPFLDPVPGGAAAPEMLVPALLLAAGFLALLGLLAGETGERRPGWIDMVGRPAALGCVAALLAIGGLNGAIAWAVWEERGRDAALGLAAVAAACLTGGLGLAVSALRRR
jgi:hypothetical protein